MNWTPVRKLPSSHVRNIPALKNDSRARLGTSRKPRNHQLEKVDSDKRVIRHGSGISQTGRLNRRLWSGLSMLRELKSLRSAEIECWSDWNERPALLRAGFHKYLVLYCARTATYSCRMRWAPSNRMSRERNSNVRISAPVSEIRRRLFGRGFFFHPVGVASVPAHLMTDAKAGDWQNRQRRLPVSKCRGVRFMEQSNESATMVRVRLGNFIVYLYYWEYFCSSSWIQNIYRMRSGPSYTC